MQFDPNSVEGMVEKRMAEQGYKMNRNSIIAVVTAVAASMGGSTLLNSETKPVDPPAVVQTEEVHKHEVEKVAPVINVTVPPLAVPREVIEVSAQIREMQVHLQGMSEAFAAAPARIAKLEKDRDAVASWSSQATDKIKANESKLSAVAKRLESLEKPQTRTRVIPTEIISTPLTSIEVGPPIITSIEVGPPVIISRPPPVRTYETTTYSQPFPWLAPRVRRTRSWSSTPQTYLNSSGQLCVGGN
jgi:hypothetical protein